MLRLQKLPQPWHSHLACGVSQHLLIIFIHQKGKKIVLRQILRCSVAYPVTLYTPPTTSIYFILLFFYVMVTKVFTSQGRCRHYVNQFMIDD